MRHLRIASDMQLPVDLATHVTLVAGKRGSGKTNTAKRIVEQAVRAGVPVAILDPADVWHGLRAGRDGKASGGLPVHIFGGRRADLPLEPTAGTLLADVVVEQRVSVVMAIREFSGGERARFVTDFAERLIRRNREPLLLVLEEAHEVMPQSPARDETRSLGAMLRVVRLGRSSGIGLLEVTQRLAQLNKTATTQADVLFAHRTIGPQDRNALEEWIKYHHAGQHRAAFMEQLPALKTGEAWVWAPDFPEEPQPIGLVKVRVEECETFNSHATPKVGERRQEPKALAAVDLERLQQQMSATIERAKADDPRELRKLLQERDRKIRQLEGKSFPAAAAEEPVPVLTEADRELLARLINLLRDTQGELANHTQHAVSNLMNRVREFADDLTTRAATAQGQAADRVASRLEKAGFQRILEKLDRVAAAPGHNLTEAARSSASLNTHVPARSAQANPKPASARQATSGPGEPMPPGEKAVLTAAAMYQDGVTRDQLGVLTGYKRSSRDAYIARLAAKGWTSSANGHVVATPAGIDALGSDFEPLPTGAALLDWWRARLPKGERDVLEVLVAAQGNGVRREAIDGETGFKRSSRDAYLARLSSRRLVQSAGPGMVRASWELFE